MADLPKAPVRGDDILYAFMRLRAFIHKERLVSVSGGRLKQTEAGRTLEIIGNGYGAGAVSYISSDPTGNGGGAYAAPSTFGHIYAFETFSNEAKTGVVVEPGDIVFGPGCPASEWIEWASIASVTTTPAVTATDCFVWLEIDVANISASMHVGSKSAMQGAVTGDDLKTIMAWPLVETVWSGGVITKVKNLQCGNVVIPRL